MKKVKIAVVLGTRPEAIKLFPIIKKLYKEPLRFKTIIIATGQHKELIQQVFKSLKFKPDIDFQIMKTNQKLADLTFLLTSQLTQYLKIQKPDFILVQGDTTSTFCAALAAYHNKIKLIHIEAGLRTHNKFNPYPEEINRVLISRLADYHFAPTKIAEQNLLDEGIKEDKIFVTGNTVIDTVKFVYENCISSEIKESFPKNFRDKKLLLVTVHRRESFGPPLENICLALEKIAEASSKFQIILPLHPNPNVQKVFAKVQNKYPNFNIVQPMSYPKFLYYMSEAFLILTDSGGLVEEASFLGKPVLILREVTERPDSLNAGIALLVGTAAGKIFNRVLHLSTCSMDYKQMARKLNLYGDGHAAEKIIKTLWKLY